jgi:endoglucanase
MAGLHVQGNQIINGAGQVVRLLGVDRSGTEYACIQGWGIFDGPNNAASVQAIASWQVNAVRVPLNEDCWLNINGVNPAYGGSNYQLAIANYVSLLNQNGIAAILDLHWSAPGTQQATGQEPMPDQDHSPAFWTSVASYFKGNSSVLFDLYNEPYPDNNQDTTTAWQCWLDGGSCGSVGFNAAGMQELVTTVRNTGATNIIMVGGVGYAGILSQWLSYRPVDPLNELAASWHDYNFSWCTNLSCWSSQVAPVAQTVPLIAGEIGENDCAHGFIDQLMPWLDGQGASYLGWTWDTWNCSSGPALITDYSGAPTNFGVGFKNHLAALGGSSPTPTPTAKPASPTPTRTPTPTAGTSPTPTMLATATPTATPRHHRKSPAVAPNKVFSQELAAIRTGVR